MPAGNIYMYISFMLFKLKWDSVYIYIYIYIYTYLYISHGFVVVLGQCGSRLWLWGARNRRRMRHTTRTKLKPHTGVRMWPRRLDGGWHWQCQLTWTRNIILHGKRQRRIATQNECSPSPIGPSPWQTGFALVVFPLQPLFFCLSLLVRFMVRLNINADYLQLQAMLWLGLTSSGVEFNKEQFFF